MTTAIHSVVTGLPERFRRSGALSLARKGSWGIADQMLLSLTNFVTMVLLARGLGPAAFGTFSLVYGGMLFANSFQAALITQPHGVLSAARKGEAYASYTTSVAWGQVIFAILAALLALNGALVSALMDWPIAHLMLALAPCLVAWQFHEFVRRVLYHETRFSAAFANDLLCYGGQTLAIGALWWTDALTPAVALYAIGVTSALAAGLGVWQLRQSLSGAFDATVFQENWQFGKWLAGAELGYWFSSQSYLYLAGFLLGMSATGTLKAAYVLFGPMRILGFFLKSILPNRFARTLADDGPAPLERQVRTVYWSVAPLMAAYCLLVAVFASSLLHLMYGADYAGHTTVLVLYAVFAFTAFMSQIVACALKAGQLTRRVFASQMYASLVALPLGWVFIEVFGVEGAVVGMIVTSLVVNTSNWRAYHRDLLGRRSRGRDVDATSGGATLDAAVTTPIPAIVPANASPAGDLLLRVLYVLDEAGIPYCILHGYESYPQSVGSDVDLLVPPDALPDRLARVLTANAQRLDAQVVQWVHGAAHFIVLAGHGEDGLPFFLHLHVTPDYHMRRVTYYAADEVLAVCRRWQGMFWVPAPAMQFGCLLARRIDKGSITTAHARQLVGLYREDPEGCRSHVERLLGPRMVPAVLHAARTGDWRYILEVRRGLRLSMRWRAARRRPRALIDNCFGAVERFLDRCYRADSGLSVVFLGPDGSGKSSVLMHVRDAIGAAFGRTERRSFPPGLLRRRAGELNATPHAQPPRSRVGSVVRALGYWMLYHTLGHHLIVRWALVRRTLVLHDRHIMDALVDPRRYRYGGPMSVLQRICRYVPAPDLVILLDAPVEVIQARKREVPPAETARQRSAYLALVEPLENGHVIDASQPLDDVCIQTTDLILSHLARRTSRRFGLESVT